MHRRCASCSLGVLANCALTLPSVVFESQAQYFLHSGLPTLYNHSPTAGNILCTGVALRASSVLLQTVHLPCPGLFWMHRRSTSAFWAANPIQPFPDRVSFFMHRCCVSCSLGVFANCALTLPWIVFHAQAQYFVHSWLPTLSHHSPTAGHFAKALRFVHLKSFRKLCIYLALACFGCTGAVLRAFRAANLVQLFSDRRPSFMTGIAFRAV